MKDFGLLWKTPPNYHGQKIICISFCNLSTLFCNGSWITIIQSGILWLIQALPSNLASMQYHFELEEYFAFFFSLLSDTYYRSKPFEQMRGHRKQKVGNNTNNWIFMLCSLRFILHKTPFSFKGKKKCLSICIVFAQKT